MIKFLFLANYPFHFQEMETRMCGTEVQSVQHVHFQIEKINGLFIHKNILNRLRLHPSPPFQYDIVYLIWNYTHNCDVKHNADSSHYPHNVIP